MIAFVQCTRNAEICTELRTALWRFQGDAMVISVVPRILGLQLRTVIIIWNCDYKHELFGFSSEKDDKVDYSSPGAVERTLSLVDEGWNSKPVRKGRWKGGTDYHYDLDNWIGKQIFMRICIQSQLKSNFQQRINANLCTNCTSSRWCTQQKIKGSRTNIPRR